MTMNKKTILTCAVTGGAPYNKKHPSMPVTPKQIADACIEAASAGASIVHIHVRDPETGEGNRDRAHFREVVDRVRQTGTDIVLNLTCGMGAYFLPDPENEGHMLPGSDVVGVDERVAHVEELLPEIATLDIVTNNQVEGPTEYIYFSPTHTLRAMAKRFQAAGVKPELEVFGPGDILFGNKLVEEGLIDGPPMMQMVLGVQWAAPHGVETILYQKSLMAPGTIWGAFGIGREQMPMLAHTLLLGGNIRVGLEDNLYMSRGVWATNGQLVERAYTLVNAVGGYDVATPAETREILKLRTPGA
ncbi:MAG TPA: 3-keto-5-aminohexanoate cleavage protein [Sphingopyxis sp.]|uniref:3-keto-5-aminohexanoate cleavage protein n=1 Tax=Sphingopyxis sp. TaxID=1908224 RepID=UPI002C0F0BB2|nr:3-keto-5-aminohexanoate cleavage protein [Sphingopyxis sp.]HWW57793.1 3-keto-5-aminohexanoate cleavage protein [Sphingopyxis sp.]